MNSHRSVRLTVFSNEICFERWGAEMRQDDLMDWAIIAFGIAVLLFGYFNTKKNGDGFMVALSVIVALVAFGWVYLK